MSMIMSVPEHCLISYLKYLNMQFTWTAKGLMISLEALSMILCCLGIISHCMILNTLPLKYE